MPPGRPEKRAGPLLYAERCWRWLGAEQSLQQRPHVRHGELEAARTGRRFLLLPALVEERLYRMQDGPVDPRRRRHCALPLLTQHSRDLLLERGACLLAQILDLL